MTTTKESKQPLNCAQVNSREIIFLSNASPTDSAAKYSNSSSESVSVAPLLSQYWGTQLVHMTNRRRHLTLKEEELAIKKAKVDAERLEVECAESILMLQLTSVLQSLKLPNEEILQQVQKLAPEKFEDIRTFVVGLLYNEDAKTTANQRDTAEKLTEEAAAGKRSRAWYLINDEPCLVSGNSPGGWEPFAEVMAYKIGSYLKVNMAPCSLECASKYPEIKMYDGCAQVSVCKQYVCEGTTMLSLAEYLDNVLGCSVQEWIKSTKPSDSLQDLIMLDALFGIEDRDPSTVDLLFENGRLTGMAPFHDFGSGLLAHCPDEDLETRSKSHRLQIPGLFKVAGKSQFSLVDLNKKFKNYGYRLAGMLDSLIGSELKMLPEQRAKAIFRYIQGRGHKFECRRVPLK